jgi:hypothetical protein
MYRHPATSGCRHLLEGCFWGYLKRTEVKKRWNYGGFLADFGSVPGSQININKIQSLLNIIDMDYRLEIPQFTLYTSQRGGVASSNAQITILRNTSRSDLAAFDGPEFTDRTPRTSRPIDVVICRRRDIFNALNGCIVELSRNHKGCMS